MIDCSVTQNSSHFLSNSVIVKPGVKEDNNYLDITNHQSHKTFDLKGKDDIAMQLEEGTAIVCRGTTVGENKESKVGIAVAELNTKICELVRIC